MNLEQPYIIIRHDSSYRYFMIVHIVHVVKDIFTYSERTNQVCIMASEENETVKLLTETLESKVSMVQCIVTSMDMPRMRSRETFNIVVFFHLHEIDQDNQLLDFAAMLDVDHQVKTFENLQCIV